MGTLQEIANLCAAVENSPQSVQETLHNLQLETYKLLQIINVLLKQQHVTVVILPDDPMRDTAQVTFEESTNKWIIKPAVEVKYDAN